MYRPVIYSSAHLYSTHFPFRSIPIIYVGHSARTGICWDSRKSSFGLHGRTRSQAVSSVGMPNEHELPGRVIMAASTDSWSLFTRIFYNGSRLRRARDTAGQSSKKSIDVGVQGKKHCPIAPCLNTQHVGTLLFLKVKLTSAPSGLRGIICIQRTKPVLRAGMLLCIFYPSSLCST